MGRKKHRRTPTVLVLGGYGFVGRYAVEVLQRGSANVLIGTRGLNTPGAQDDAGNTIKERHVRLHECVQADDWKSTLSGVDVVINAVGILRERPAETFEQVHHLAVAALANACKARSIPLVHVSALGIDGPVQNPFSASKRRGEEAILDSGCTGTIVRASVVDAPDGYGSGWFHSVAQWPVWLIPAHANRAMSPVKASDLGEALAKLAIEHTAIKRLTNPAKIVDVGCGETFTLECYLHKLRNTDALHLPKPLFILRVPERIASLCATVFDLLNLTPYSSGHHELLKYDNIPVSNSLPLILGRPPTAIAAAPANRLGPVPTPSPTLTRAIKKGA